MKPKVAIVICTYNQEKFLEICLQSLFKKTTYPEYKIFFVDDSGSGKIGKNISKKFPKVDVTCNKHNQGFSGANNTGIRKALSQYNPDYVLLLNDDCEIIQKNWLTKLVQVGQTDKQIGILGAKIIYPDKELQNIGGYLKKWEIVKELRENLRKPFEVDHIMGAVMMIKKKVLVDIGLLDEAYTPYLLEDTDYCLTAKKRGYRIVSVPSVEVIHKKGKTLRSLENASKMYIRFKNDMYFSIRHVRGSNKLFRLFVYLPLVSLFKKKNDQKNLKNIKNYTLRKQFLTNTLLLIKAYLRTIACLPRILTNRYPKAIANK